MNSKNQWFPFIFRLNKNKLGKAFKTYANSKKKNIKLQLSEFIYTSYKNKLDTKQRNLNEREAEQIKDFIFCINKYWNAEMNKLTNQLVIYL